MKLVIGIVNGEDAANLLDEITKAGFRATKLSTSGGFLKMGNVTVLIGVEEEKVEELLDIFRNCCSRRTQMVSAVPPYMGEGFISSTPVEITIGGATLFVLDVENFIKL